MGATGLIFGLAMTHLLPSRFSAILLLGLALLLPGCCANNVCNCPGEAQADVIKLVFSKTAFAAIELDTLVLQRYPLLIIPANGPNPGTKPETVTLIRTAAQAYDTIYLNNSTPFAQANATAKLDQYQYYVRYFPAPRKARSAFALVIDNAVIKGSLDGNGCCTCYTNTQKTISTRKDSTASATTAIATNLKPNPVFIITK